MELLLASFIQILWCFIGCIEDLRRFSGISPYRDLEAGDNHDNQSLKIQVARLGIEPRTSCSASQELTLTENSYKWLIVHLYIHL